MPVAPRCRFCNAEGPGESLPVIDQDFQRVTWQLCDRCFGLFKLGFLQVRPGFVLDMYVRDHWLQLTAAEARDMLYRGAMIVEREHRRHQMEEPIVNPDNAQPDQPDPDPPS